MANSHVNIKDEKDKPVNEKHLEFIQNTINRMASNSFIIKGWCITLVSALFAVLINFKSKNLFIISLVPIIFFSFLDAYYLWKERLFIELYNRIITNGGEEKIIPYSMDVKFYCKQSLWKTWLYSPTVTIFYIILGVTVFCLCQKF